MWYDLFDRGLALGDPGREGFFLGLLLLGFKFSERLVGVLEELALLGGNLLDFAAEIKDLQLVHVVDADHEVLELGGTLLAIGDTEGFGQLKLVDVVASSNLVGLGHDVLVRLLDRGLVRRRHLELGDRECLLVLRDLGLEGRGVGRRGVPFRELGLELLGLGLQSQARGLLGLELGAEGFERPAVGGRGVDLRLHFLRRVDRQTEIGERRFGVGKLGLDLRNFRGHDRGRLRNDLDGRGWGGGCRRGRVLDGLHSSLDPGREVLGFGGWGLDGGRGVVVRYGHGVSICGWYGFSGV